RQETRDGVLQRFCQWQFTWAQRRVPRIVRRVTRVVGCQRGRWDGVAATPDLGLSLAMLRSGFSLVQSLKRPVVPFVEPPALFNRDPKPIEGVERNEQRANRPLQHRRVSNVDLIMTLG